jgi:hypothetical protein
VEFEVVDGGCWLKMRSRALGAIKECEMRKARQMMLAIGRECVK